MQVVREIETAAEGFRKDRRVDAMKLEDLLREGFVLRHHQAVRARSGVILANEFEKAGDLEVGRVVAGKRLGQVEHQVAFHPRQRQQALRRPVELVHRRLVTKLGEGVGDLFFHFLLVQRAGDRRLLS
jgi:hypothetical protein